MTNSSYAFLLQSGIVKSGGSQTRSFQWAKQFLMAQQIIQEEHIKTLSSTLSFLVKIRVLLFQAQAKHPNHVMRKTAYYD